MAWIIAYALAKKVQRTAVTIPLTTNLDFGGYRGISVGAPVNPNDISRKTELDTHAAIADAHHTKTTTRAEITDFWDTPFWVNIPDKPLGLKKVVEIDVTADTTIITITGLDINTDKFYLLLFTVKNPTASNAGYDLLVEGDLTTANYYNQEIYGTGTSIYVGRKNWMDIGWATPGERCFSSTFIVRDPDGYPRFYSYQTRKTGTEVENMLRAGTYIYTVTNITQIDVRASITNAIGAGSKLIIYGAGG